MSALQIFSFEGAEVRTVLVDGEPWWVAADVCAVLEIANVSQAVSYLDEDEKEQVSPNLISNEVGGRDPWIISEPGLYSLILRSRKPQARPFKRWITHEVIPAIRKHGRYEMAAPREMTKLEALRAAIESEEARIAAERRVAELEPAARSWDVLASGKGNFSLRETAYILNQDPNITTGPRLLKDRMFELGMIDRWDTPYSKHKTHLAQRPRSYEHPHTGEEVQAKPQLRVTIRGLQYLHKRMGGVAPLRFDQPPLDQAG